MLDKTLLIQHNDSIQRLPNEIKVGIKQTIKIESQPAEIYGDPLDFDDWECDFTSYIQFNVY